MCVCVCVCVCVHACVHVINICVSLTGVLYGIVNSVNSVGGFLSPLLVGLLTKGQVHTLSTHMYILFVVKRCRFDQTLFIFEEKRVFGVLKILLQSLGMLCHALNSQVKFPSGCSKTRWVSRGQFHVQFSDKTHTRFLEKTF